MCWILKLRAGSLSHAVGSTTMINWPEMQRPHWSDFPRIQMKTQLWCSPGISGNKKHLILSCMAVLGTVPNSTAHILCTQMRLTHINSYHSVDSSASVKSLHHWHKIGLRETKQINDDTRIWSPSHWDATRPGSVRMTKRPMANCRPKPQKTARHDTLTQRDIADIWRHSK